MIDKQTMIQNCEKNRETNLRDLISLDTDRNDLEIGTATSWEECLNLVLTNSTRNSSWNGITWVGAGSRKCFAEVHAIKRIEAGCKVDCTSCIFLGKCMNRYFLCWFQIISILIYIAVITIKYILWAILRFRTEWCSCSS